MKGKIMSDSQKSVSLTPEVKHLVRELDSGPQTLPLQAKLDSVLRGRQYEIRCYFDCVLTRLLPRRFDTQFAVDIQTESRNHSEAMRRLLKRSYELLDGGR